MGTTQHLTLISSRMQALASTQSATPNGAAAAEISCRVRNHEGTQRAVNPVPD